MRTQYVISNSTNPFLNIAVENYLLSLNETEIVTFYLWKNHRTVVIGQNQNPYAECNVELLENEGGHLMRRRTGGGAVYHDDGNINFSFIVPKTLYDQSRQFLVLQKAVEAYGLSAEVSGRNDVLCGGRKFSGNAFSHGKYQYLHHGTILIKGNMDDLQRYLRVNPIKLHKHGVDSVRSRVVNLSELAPVNSENIVPILLNAFQHVYSCPLTDHPFDQYASAPAVELSFDRLKQLPAVKEIETEFASDEWRFGRWRTFKAQQSASFTWGGIELSLDIDEVHSIIRGVDIATDALQVEVIENIKHALIGASTKQPPCMPEDLNTEQQQIVKDIYSLIY